VCVCVLLILVLSNSLFVTKRQVHVLWRVLT